MSNYIEENRLQEAIKKNSYVIKTEYGYDVGMTLGTILRTVMEIPKETIVDIIECRDCKWYQNGKYITDEKFCFRLLSDNGRPTGYRFPSNGFCSFAERKQIHENNT